MKPWLLFGLNGKRVTTKFPTGPAEDVPLWSTSPVKIRSRKVECPTGAITGSNVDMEKCISCGRCSDAFMPDGQAVTARAFRTSRSFRKSFHIYMFDAGSCGACNLEVNSLSNPFYDLSRLGISFAPNPKHADAILVVGVLADGMEKPLKKAIESLPEPRLVFAVGACAISGGIIGKSVKEEVDADVIVPGCPPSPYAILDALQKSRGAD